jgi:glycosyltransferase involved in cell wall biosynthesis
MAPFCSTIIPTVGRTKLARAVRSVLDQQLPDGDFELIVVNDSGQPLPMAEWQHDVRVQVINTNRRERCVARNAGASVAQGAYLHFLDDDDWLLPDGLAQLRALAQASPSIGWLYGATDLYDRHGNKVIELHNELQGNCFAQVMAGEWIPMASSLVSTQAFFAAGGFNHTALYAEDSDLARRVLLHEDLAYTPIRIACMEMGIERNSQIAVDQMRNSQLAREDVLCQSGVLRRMRASASTTYLRGRIVRLYLTSSIWNVRHGRWDIAAQRLCTGLVQFMLAGLGITHADYWRALLKPYANRSFARGFESAERAVA